MKTKEEIKLEEAGIRGLHCQKCGEWIPDDYGNRQKYFAVECDCALEKTGFMVRTTNLDD